ncbi:hypothetical protein AAFC00_002540 [Neodothiora populina]|uniref:Uncharacterized protein n=1 Tax=Neodothiora populina TaxID=2781224 RepID=A0ABR3P7R1_9PEZI
MSNSTISSSSFTSAQTSLSSTTDVAAASSSFSSDVASSVSSVFSSSVEASSSAAAASTTTVEPSSTSVFTSVVSASSQPASTQLYTSVVTQTPSVAGESSVAPVTVVVTSVYSPTATAGAGTSSTRSSSAASSSTAGAASLNGSNNGSSNSSGGGLSPGGKTAVAVVVPVVVVALLVVAGLFFWRKRKQRKTEAEARRKEVEEYGFNPNNDPTLPVIAQEGNSEMTEDHSGGYRGWGNAGMSNRKASTNMSSGHTAGQPSESGSNPGGALHSPTGPPSEGNSGDALVFNGQRGTMSSDDLAALGAAPVAGAHRNNDIRRGPSNASSSYSAGNHSDNSDGNIAQSYGSSPDMYNSATYGYGQHGPYGDGSYGGGAESGMPIVRDVSARRNTRIEAGGSYQQGNSGIAQNF